MHPKDWLEYQLKIRAGKRYQMYQNHKLQKLLFGEKMFHAVFCVSAVFKDKGFTELAGRKNGVDSVDSGGPSVVLGGSLGPFGCSSIFFYHLFYQIYSNIFYQKRMFKRLHVESRPGTWRCFIFAPDRVQSVQSLLGDGGVEHPLLCSSILCRVVRLRSIQTSSTASYVSFRCIKRNTWSHEVRTSHRLYFLFGGYVCAFSDVGVAFVYDL